MRIAFIALLLVFSACSTYSEDDLGDFDKKIGAWLVQRQLDFKKTESGLYFNFLEEGQGVKVKYTDSVKVRFKGELLSGKVFEEEKHPMTFAVKDVIVGWKVEKKIPCCFFCRGVLFNFFFTGCLLVV